MIFTERKITVTNDTAKIDRPLILYRGDKNIELKITIAESQFKFRNNEVSNVIETTDASYAQLIINTPYGLPIFSDVAATKNGAVIFVITEGMVDEIKEIGSYDIQIRLLDDNKQSRATIPPVSNAIEIKAPIAMEDGSAIDGNTVNTAMANRAVTTYSTPLESFDSQGNYIKTTWSEGDLITDAKLNKIEAGIDGVNRKVASGGTGGAGLTTEQAQQLSTAYQHSQTAHAPSDAEANVQADWNITDTTSDAYIKNKPTNLATTDQIPIVPTKVSAFTNDANYATETFVTNKIATSLTGEISYNQFDYLDNIFATNFENDNIVNVTSISLSGASSVSVGSSINLTAAISPSNASNKNVIWSASNTNATISPNGLSCTVTGAIEGECVVTVTTEDGNKTTNKTITITASTEGGGEGGETNNSVLITPDITDYTSNLTSDAYDGYMFLLNYELQEGVVDKLRIYGDNKSLIVYVLEPVDGGYKITAIQTVSDSGASLSDNELNLPVTSTSRLAITGDFHYTPDSDAAHKINYLDINQKASIVNVGSFISTKETHGALAFGIMIYYTPSVSVVSTSDSSEIMLTSLSEVGNSDFVYDNCSASNKLICTGQSMAYFNKYLTFDTYNLKSRIIITDTTAKFGLMCKHSQKGALYLVNLADGKLTLHYQYTGGYTVPNVREKANITIPITRGQEYLIEVRKTGWKHTFSITNIMTGESNEVMFDNAVPGNSGSYCGKGWGSPGVICLSGQVTFKNLIYNVANFKNPKAIIIGDSITEGTNMGANTEIRYRYASLIRDNIYNGKALICGRGGDTSSGVIERLNTLYSLGFSAPITIITIGTNERGSVSNWKTNIDSIVALVEAHNSIPVICVPPACSSSFSAIQEMRDYILEKNYNTIRFDISTTVNRDGKTCDTSLFTDGVHPNKEGGIRMYNQAKIELGLLL